MLGCPEGRSAATWVDFNLFGHQIVAHLVRGYSASASHNAVDGDPVPVPHFGAALSVPQFHSLAERLKGAGVSFVIEPHLRFQGMLLIYHYSVLRSSAQGSMLLCAQVHQFKRGLLLFVQANLVNNGRCSSMIPVAMLWNLRQ